MANLEYPFKWLPDRHGRTGAACFLFLNSTECGDIWSSAEITMEPLTYSNQDLFLLSWLLLSVGRTKGTSG